MGLAGVPPMLLGTLRYLYRLRRRGGGGDPAEELLRDPLLAASVAGWLATVLWLIG
ncbi:phosphoribose diphosphate:decaprenyl-phosphate phosphoribosyltransferase [compost metagenome]